MNTKALKAKILDLAIHGKLVPQNPEHESAEKLLEKIRAEKEEKIAKGELKRDKKDSYIFVGDDKRHYEKFADGTVKDIEDEIPFEIPEGWAWCRFSDCSINRDSERKPVSAKDRKNIEKIYDYYGATGVVDKIDEYLFDEKLLLIGEDGANLLSRVKNNAFIARGKFWVNNHAHVIDAIEKDILEYLKTYINSLQLDDVITGSAQPKFTQAALNGLLIPLPPLEEQKQIISKIEEIFAQIDSLETGKADLQTAIKHAKSKILGLAIHGKLVPQNPSEEPASKLLERIRAEKEAKIAAGELKRDKNDSYIYKNPSDNCHYEKFGESKEELLEDPFEIPTEWTWIRLTNICEYIGDGDWIESKDQSSEGIRLIQTGNVGNGKFRNKAERSHFISEKTFDKLNCTEIFPGDILISRLPEPVGRSCIIPDIKQRMITAVDCSILRLNENIILPEYFCYYTQSSAYFSLIQEKCTGTTRLRISRANLEKILLPLPNKIEQKRIIEKVREIFTTLDIIESKLQ